MRVLIAPAAAVAVASLTAFGLSTAAVAATWPEEWPLSVQRVNATQDNAEATVEVESTDSSSTLRVSVGIEGNSTGGTLHPSLAAIKWSVRLNCGQKLQFWVKVRDVDETHPEQVKFYKLERTCAPDPEPTATATPEPEPEPGDNSGSTVTGGDGASGAVKGIPTSPRALGDDEGFLSGGGLTAVAVAFGLTFVILRRSRVS